VVRAVHKFGFRFVIKEILVKEIKQYQEKWLQHVQRMDTNRLRVVCHCFPPPLDVPTFAARCLYVRNDARDPSSERWKCGRERCPVILPKFRLPRKFRELLHAANLRHGTDGFTSPPKEGVLRNFFANICRCQKRDFSSFLVAVSISIKVDPLAFLVIIVCNHGEYY
jgi:hypothetical protein